MFNIRKCCNANGRLILGFADKYYEMALRKQLVMIVQVPIHKTAVTHQAARVAMNATMYGYLRLYVERFRSKVMLMAFHHIASVFNKTHVIRRLAIKGLETDKCA